MQFLTNTDRDIDLPVSNSSLTYPKLGIFSELSGVRNLLLSKNTLGEVLSLCPGGGGDSAYAERGGDAR